MGYEIDFCRSEELPELQDLLNRIFRAGRAGDMIREYPLLFDPQNARNLHVARSDGKIVSHVGVCIRDAAILGATVRIASIGAVGTDPEHRGHGLASQLMARARAVAVEQGASLMLISGGRGLYHRLGYVEVGSFFRYRVPAGDGDAGCRLAPEGEFPLTAFVRLHQREPVRFLRSRCDWERLMHAGMLMNQPADLRMIVSNGVPAAYAAVQHPRPDATGALSPLRVYEAAGDRSALARALPSLAKAYGAPAAEWIGWPDDAALASEASARGWSREESAFTGTLGIIDPRRFLAAIEPLMSERGSQLHWAPNPEGATLEVAGENHSLTWSQLTSLVFGGSTAEARAVPALGSAAAEAVAETFPLPLLWYGFNYV